MTKRLSGQEKCVAYLEKRIGESLHDMRWKWREDGCFEGEFYCSINRISLTAKFEVKMQEIRVTTDSEKWYRIPNESATFDSVGGLNDCIRWTAEKLTALNNIILERSAPYYARYEQALRGEL